MSIKDFFKNENTLFYILSAVFIGLTPLILRSLTFDIDEGIYIQQARLIQQGKVPYVDFFHHQTPLYLYALALWGKLFGNTLLAYRLLSMFALCGVAFFIFKISKAYTKKYFAVLTALLFYFAPLLHYGKLALPNSIMLLCSVAAIYLVLQKKSWQSFFLAGFLLACAILLKPIALSTGLATGLTLIIARVGLKKILLFITGGLSLALTSLIGFHFITGGLFTAVLSLQANRHWHNSGYEILNTYPFFVDRLKERGLKTVVEFNLDSHFTSFADPPFLNVTFFLVILATAAYFIIFKNHEKYKTHFRMQMTLWVLLVLLFSIFIWEPAWDHYLIQYLPPLAILSAIALSHFAQGRAKRPAITYALVTFFFLYVNFSTLLTRTKPAAFYNMQQAGLKAQKLLTFNPLVNVVAQAEPGCGLIDPFNVYGRRGLITYMNVEHFEKFKIGSREIIQCLEADTDVKIYISRWTLYFLDPTLLKYMRQLDVGRFVYANDETKVFFHDVLAGRSTLEAALDKFSGYRSD